jgi:hypothetical protein
MARPWFLPLMSYSSVVAEVPEAVQKSDVCLDPHEQDRLTPPRTVCGRSGRLLSRVIRLPGGSGRGCLCHVLNPWERRQCLILVAEPCW